MSSRSKRRGAAMATAFYRTARPRATSTEAWLPRDARGLPESGRELGDDAVAEHVRHLEDRLVDGLVVGDVGGETAVEAVDAFLERLVQVRLHHRAHLAPRPVARVGLG